MQIYFVDLIRIVPDNEMYPRIFGYSYRNKVFAFGYIFFLFICTWIRRFDIGCKDKHDQHQCFPSLTWEWDEDSVIFQDIEQWNTNTTHPKSNHANTFSLKYIRIKTIRGSDTGINHTELFFSYIHQKKLAWIWSEFLDIREYPNSDIYFLNISEIG